MVIVAGIWRVLKGIFDFLVLDFIYYIPLLVLLIIFLIMGIFSINAGFYLQKGIFKGRMFIVVEGLVIN